MAPTLTIQQKQMLLYKMDQHRAKGDSSMQSDMRKWAEHKIRLSPAPSQATILSIIAAHKNIMTIFNSFPAKTNRIRESVAPRLEEALVA